VTFTSDTKEDDGFSIMKLKKQWNGETPAAESTEAPSPQTSDPETKIPKKEKKRKQRQPDPDSTDSNPAQEDPSFATQPGTAEVPEYVHYLQQFYTDKANWKFNKKKQKDVLKNLFNVYRIPPEHNDAITAYIAGLDGRGAQERIIESSESVLRAFLERQGEADAVADTDSPRARKAAYEVALQRELEKLEQIGAGQSEYDHDQLREMRQEYERSKRAEAVLAELLTKELARPTPAPTPALASAAPPPLNQAAPKHTRFDDDDDEEPAKGTAKPTGPPKPRPGKRKRKARTEVSSSSESSSSDDSSSESEGD